MIPIILMRFLLAADIGVNATSRRVRPRRTRLRNRNRRVHRFVLLSAHHVRLTPIDNP